jgi:Ca2+-binding RTX toxin-like protein
MSSTTRRYEDFRTTFGPSNIAGPAGDVINEGLSNWLDNARQQLADNLPDSEFVSKGFKAFTFLVKTGALGEIISAAISPLEIRVYASGDVSLVYNTAELNLGQTILDVAYDAGVESLIGFIIASAFGLTGPAALLGVAVASGLIWDGIKWVGQSVQDILEGTQDIEVHFRNAEGNHLATVVYPDGIEYNSANDAIKFLAASSEFDLAGGTIEIDASGFGHSDDGNTYKIGDDLYVEMAAHIGISMSELFDIFLTNGNVSNTDWMLLNYEFTPYKFYPTENTPFAFIIATEINDVSKHILIHNLVKNGAILTGDGNGINFILPDASAGLVATSDDDLIVNATELDGNDGEDTILGTQTNDLLSGGADNDIVDGKNGADFIYGNDGNDTLYGGIGDDTLIGGEGNNQLNGGEGIDTADYRFTNNNATINLGSGTANIDNLLVDIDDVLTDVENLILGNGWNNIEGSSANNQIISGSKDDTIKGQAGDDTIVGGAGADTIEGNAGTDVLAYYPDDAASHIEIFIDSFNSTLGGVGGTINERVFVTDPSDGSKTQINSVDVFSGIEEIVATNFDDEVYLNIAIDRPDIITLDLGLGINTIYYSDANDTGSININTVNLSSDGAGGYGSLVLYGNGGSDTLTGYTSNDTLVGGAGNDRLIGGGGTDTFFFGKADGEDTIFSGGNSDRIGIFYNNNSVTSNLDSGNTPSVLIGTAVESTISGWQYEMSYGGHKSLFNWGGDPTVAGSTGTLAIDFDNTGAYDIVIENFASGDFGIHIDGAEEEDDGNGDIPNPFTTPGANNLGISWNNGYFNFGGILPIGFLIPTTDEDIDLGGGIAISADQGIGALIGGIGETGAVEGGTYSLVAHDPVNYGEWPEADIEAGVLGDPHVVTFDGLFYDFQDAGEFTLIQSTNENPFTVQARMREWDLGDAVGDKFSVNTAIATELNGVKIGFYIKGSLPYDLTAAAADSDPYNDEEPVLYIGDYGYFIPDNGIMMVEDGYIYRNGDNYTVINATGDTITVTVHDQYIDFRASSPAARQGNVEGMLGNFDGDTSNDFKLDSGTDLGSSISSNTLYDVFGEDWRITQGESLFLYGEGQNTSSFNNPDFDNVQRTLADFDPALVSAAQTAAIAEGFDPASAVFDAAVLDFLVMGYVEYDETWQQLEAKTVVEADIDNPSDIIMGTTANDSMIGTAGKDYMMGLEGNDTIYGRGDNDTIVGGAGNDIIYGEGGIDTYIHIQGDGNDTINSGEPNSADTIIMQDDNGNLLTLENLQFSRTAWNSPNLVVTNRFSGESITITNQLAYTGKYIAFVNNIDVRGALNFLGTDASETIYGTNYADTIEGGLGDDVLNGYAGIDIYIHNEGDGNDTINSGEANSSDTIIMKDDEGVLLTQDDLQFSKISLNLLVKNIASGETLTITNQFASAGKSIASVNEIDITGGLKIDGTDVGEVIQGTGYADTLTGGLGSDTIYGSYGADLYIHNEGDGNDYLFSGEVNSSDVISMRDSNNVEIAATDLMFSQMGYDLVVTHVSTNETLVLDNMYYSTGHTFATLNGIDLDTVLL